MHNNNNCDYFDIVNCYPDRAIEYNISSISTIISANLIFLFICVIDLRGWLMIVLIIFLVHSTVE